jgi:integral membrane protein
MLKSAIGRLRLIGLLEGTSFLFLLYVAVVEKRIRGNEEAIMIPGWIHGFLFVLFCAALFLAGKPAGWARKTRAKVLLAALLPFGPYVIEPWLRREDRRVREQR